VRTSVTYCPNGMAGRAFKTNARLVRSGIVTEDFLEMTPVVFRDELLLLASAKEGDGAYHEWDFSLCIERVATHEVIAAWGEGYSLASAFVHDDTFYMLYSQQVTPRWWFETYLTRSRDLINWEDSPAGPVLDPEGAEDVNTSDPDLVEFRASPASPATTVRVYYGYGNQKGKGAITWADFDGTLPEFFRHYYD